MSNHWLPLGKEKVLSGEIDLSAGGDTIKAMLVKSSHTPSDSQEFVSDISSGDRLASTADLSSRTVTSGTFDAADSVWASVTSGSTGTYIYIYKDTGSAATSPLLIIIDTGTNLPISTNGGNIDVVWNASGIAAF